MATSQYTVTGMTCSHCESSVREEVEALDGIQSVEISARDGSLVITSSSPVADEDVARAVAEAGYTVARA